MSLEVITGPMFAGKTEELLRRVRRAEIAGEEVKIYTHKVNGKKITTHNGKSLEAEKVEEVKDCEENIIVIDEAQFFDKKIIDQIKELAESKRIIVAGTDQDFRGEPWSPMPELMSMAEDLTKLTAICVKCGNKATKNQRLNNGDPAEIDEPRVKVGADDIYEARCRKCHTIQES